MLQQYKAMMIPVEMHDQIKTLAAKRRMSIIEFVTLILEHATKV